MIRVDIFFDKLIKEIDNASLLLNKEVVDKNIKKK